jgi:RNA polymerase sigma factor for flagellar operon FliA
VTTVLTDKQKETVMTNLPLVEHIVNRVGANLPASHCRDDLVQTGILGLISATVRFDPTNGTAFSTYAGRRIEGAIIDMLRQTDWAPRSVRTLERRLTAIERDRSLGSTRSADEIRKELGIDQDQLDQLRRDIDRARIDSLDRPVRTSGDGLLIPLSSTVFDEDDAVEHRVDEHELLGYLRDGVGLLPERHRTVVVGYFFEGRSMTELGALLGVTQSRASQIKEEAIRMLRHALDQAYRDEGDQERSLTERERAFAKTMAAARPWRDRLAAGKGFMAIR